MEKIDKKKKAEFMEKIRKAGDPKNYETSWDEKKGRVSKEKIKVIKGKFSKAKGSRFELKVRRDLESKGRIVDKWNNNVDLSSKDDSGEPDKGELIIAKRKFNPFSKALTIGTGFPDFISIKPVQERLYSVIGVEAKINGILSKIEKEKCAWYLQKNIFSEIWIAKQGEKRGEIVYDDFSEKYGKKYNKP